MNTPSLSFSYPRRGLFGDFATFRLGARAAQKHPPGSEVALIDSRSKRTLKHATVTAVYVGTLSEMASRHAREAHNWKESPPEQRAALLIASMVKRYPPGRCCETSICTVIYLKEKTTMITMPTIVTHTYFCHDCLDTTDIHAPDGQEPQGQCEHCGSQNVEKQL